MPQDFDCCGVPRIHVDELSEEDFALRFDAKRPVMLTGALTNWTASAWTLTSLRERAGGHEYERFVVVEDNQESTFSGPLSKFIDLLPQRWGASDRLMRPRF